ncbi:MAG: N-acetylglucosamine-6-phosphate deacetylase [Natronospirillum sp.]
MKSAILGAKVFTGERFLDHHAIILDGTGIDAVVPQSEVPTSLPCAELNGGIVAPGFIDLQVNGGGGVLFNNEPSVDALKRITDGHRTVGTTSLLPTTISDRRENLEACIAAVLEAMPVNPGLLGVHIEGPFFNTERRGVHREEYIRAITETDIDFLSRIAADLPILLTLAPEMTQPGQIARLVRAGIRVSAGHSNASYADVERAIREGLTGFTHLYNAMRSFQGREPGVVGAALADSSTYAGIIVDNYHVHRESVRLAYRAKPLGKLYLVSDSMATIGAVEPWFELYGERITAVDGRLISAEGRLAGSAIGLVDAVRLCVNDIGIPLDHALRMASRFPAEYVNADDYLGWIKPGHRADLVHLTPELTVAGTWVAGDYQAH